MPSTYIVLVIPTINQFHHKVGDAVFVDGVNGDDVRMGDGGGRTALRGGTVAGPWRSRPVRREDLDGDHAVQSGVAGLEHDSHASPAEDLFDFILANFAEAIGALDGVMNSSETTWES